MNDISTTSEYPVGALTNDEPDLFVGRKEELAKLNGLLEKTKCGSGCLVLVSGEAGIGKNSLGRRFASEAIEKGTLYITGKFDQSHSLDPYAPFVEITQRLSPLNMDFSPNNRDTFSAKANLDKFKNEEFVRGIQNEKNMLQQRIVSALNAISKNNPLLIEFTDVHFAPLTAWQFIHYLAHALMDQKIMIVLTLRQDGRATQSDKIPVYADVLQRMNRENLLEIIQLKRFGRREIREYINHFFPKRDFSSNFIPLLHEISQGLPDQLPEILRLMSYLGVIHKEEDIWFDDDNIDKENLAYLLSPEHEVRKVEDQIRNLSVQQITILEYSSLLPSSLDYDLLSGVLGLPRYKLIKELDFLKEQKILTEGEEERFNFKRTTFRTLFYNRIESSRIARMHREILTVAEKLAQSKENDWIFLLAHFSSQIGNEKKSFNYLQKAGEYAVQKMAFPEAKEFFEKAIKLIAIVSAKGGSKVILNLLMEAAWLDRVLGYWADSLIKYTMIRKLCDIADYNLKNQILVQEGLTYFRLNDWKNSSSSFHTALLNLHSISLYDRAMATYGLGNVFFETSQYRESKSYYHEALKMAEEIDSAFLKANIFNNLGAIESIQGNGIKAIALYSQGIPLFKELNDNYGLARLYNNIGMTYTGEKDWIKANEFYGKSLSISDQCGLVPMKSITFLNRALASLYLGKFEEAREYNFKALKILTHLKDELGLAEYHKIQGIIERVEGNWTEGDKNFQAALEKYHQLDNKLGIAETQYELGILGEAKSEYDEMKDWMQKALETYQVLGIGDKVKLIEHQLKEFQVSNPIGELDGIHKN